ncbi:hypothetical protein V6N13_066602 [Hibiscus sabdariffa]
MYEPNDFPLAYIIIDQFHFRSCNHNAVLPESWREKEMFDMNLSWKRLGNSSSDRENVMPEFTWRNITPENQHYFFLKAEFPKAAPLMG